MLKNISVLNFITMELGVSFIANNYQYWRFCVDLFNNWYS